MGSRTGVRVSVFIGFNFYRGLKSSKTIPLGSLHNQYLEVMY